MIPLKLTFLTFVFLVMAICSVWLKPVQIIKKIHLRYWLGFFAASLMSGLFSGVINLLGVIEVGLFGYVVYALKGSPLGSKQNFICITLTIILALALGLHWVPGFNNPIVISHLVLSVGAVPFTQYANFDKGAVGLILLALMCNRVHSMNEFGQLLKQIFPITIITTVVVFFVGMLFGYVGWDFKITEITPIFLLTNLFLSVIAEEVFFRGLLQERFVLICRNWNCSELIAVLCSAILFAFTHITADFTYVFLTLIAGIGYAYAYHVTKKIEASIVVHFIVNAIHFIGFTYPHF